MIVISTYGCTFFLVRGLSSTLLLSRRGGHDTMAGQEDGDEEWRHRALDEVDAALCLSLAVMMVLTESLVVRAHRELAMGTDLRYTRVVMRMGVGSCLCAMWVARRANERSVREKMMSVLIFAGVCLHSLEFRFVVSTGRFLDEMTLGRMLLHHFFFMMVCSRMALATHDS